MKISRLLKCPEVYLSILLAVLGLLYCSGKIIGKNVTLQRGQETIQTAFPLLEKMNQGEVFVISFDVNSDSPYDIHVIPDDCVQSFVVNGSEIALDGIKGLCDFNGGFRLGYKRFGGTGKDHFEVRIRNGGGPGGLNVKIVSERAMAYVVLKYSMYIVFVALCLCVLLRLKIGWTPLVIIVLGIVLRCAFVDALPSPAKYGHDVDGHVSYVQYIVNKGKIPQSEDCWTCYHPPVYFALMAPIWKTADVLNTHGDVALQMASFLLSVAILVMGFLVMRMILCGPALNMATLVWTFWPVLILSCPRIGNDQLFYLLHIVCLWGGLGYIKNRNGKQLFMAVLASLLAVWTKSTGVITVGICALSIVVGYFSPIGSFRLKKMEIASICLFVLTLASCGLKFFTGSEELVNNAHSLNGGLRVGNDIVNFLYIDIRQLIAAPFTNPWDNELGRQYFLNYMQKTSLFGEFILLRNPAGRFFAEAANISFFILVIYGLRGFWKTKINRFWLVMVVQLVAFVCALAFLRNQYPFSSSNDFRYIVPSLLSVIPFFAIGITAVNGSTKWKFFGYLASVVFAISSIAVMTMVIANS